MAGRRKQAQFDSEPVAEDLDQGPTRRCVTTRVRHNRNDLIRFVVDPDGVVVPDLAAKLPGRGVWVSADRAAVITAMKQSRFAAGFKRRVTVRPDLADQCAQLLRARTLEALALANKAGLVVTGFEKVSAALGAGDVTALVTGSDGATDGAAKLRRKHRAISAATAATRPASPASDNDLGGGGNAAAAMVAAPPDEPDSLLRTPEINVLSIEELSLAIGRANVVHAAIKSGGAATRFIREAERLTRFGPDRVVAERHEPPMK